MHLRPADIHDQKILLSPLDWGMGHTTRCIPLIRTFMKNRNQVLFAGNQAQVSFVRREFQGIRTFLLDGYNVTLHSQRSTYWQMLRQLRKIGQAIRRERKFVEVLAAEEKIDLVISDNRYGFRATTAKNIFITHQLNLPVPSFSALVNRRLSGFIQKFDACWIPDEEKDPACGKMVQGDPGIPKLFIGRLCRFEKDVREQQYNWLGIVSGPEPERTRFARLLQDYLSTQPGRSALVGVSGTHSCIDFFEDPDTRQLQDLIHQSEQVISRAGYTTIMEMLSLEKRATLIPTPGQYEQEYLANTLKNKNLTFVSEKSFFS